MHIRIDHPLNPPYAHCWNICRKVTGHYILSIDISLKIWLLIGQSLLLSLNLQTKCSVAFALNAEVRFFDPVTVTDWMSMAMVRLNSQQGWKPTSISLSVKKGIIKTPPTGCRKTKFKGRCALWSSLVYVDGFLLDIERQYLKTFLATFDSFGLSGVEQVYYDFICLRLDDN